MSLFFANIIYGINDINGVGSGLTYESVSSQILLNSKSISNEFIPFATNNTKLDNSNADKKNTIIDYFWYFLTMKLLNLTPMAAPTAPTADIDIP